MTVRVNRAYVDRNIMRSCFQIYLLTCVCVCAHMFEKTCVCACAFQLSVEMLLGLCPGPAPVASFIPPA